MQYEITLGIPVYAAADYIAETMKSALGQTYSDIEFLIVDDRADDGTIDIVEHIKRDHPRGKDIRIIRNDKNMGVSFCRNLIMDEARGKYLYFLDSDDTIESYTIQLLIDAIKAFQAQVAYASYDIIDSVKGSVVRTYQKDKLQLSQEGELAIYAFKNTHIFHVSVCNVLVDVDFLRKTGVRFIDTNFWEDMAFTTELITKVSRAVLLPDVTYHYLQHLESLSHYRERELLTKEEIMQNASTIAYLKGKAKEMKGHSCLPFLCSYLEMNSFYMVCHILKRNSRIVPKISCSEMQLILQHPFGLCDVLHFRNERWQNIWFWLLGRMPIFIAISSVWLLGKIKRVI